MDFTQWRTRNWPVAQSRHVHSRLYPTNILPPVQVASSAAQSSSAKRTYDGATWRNVSSRIGSLSWKDSQDADRKIAMSKWRSILQVSPESSSLGRSILSDILLFKSDDHLMQSLQDTLSMKATKTLHKRANAVLKYMSWCTFKQVAPFPVAEPNVYAFLHDCAWQSPGFGSSFKESLNFLSGVMGFDGARETAMSPRVSSFCSGMRLT